MISAILLVPRLIDRGRTADAAPASWVWLGHHGVQVKVPSDWKFVHGTMCTPNRPNQPQVLMGHIGGEPLATCDGFAEQQVEHPPTLEFLAAGATIPAPWDEFPHRTVGEVSVIVHWGEAYAAAHPGIAATADEIVASASTFSVDVNGCADVVPGDSSLVSALADLPVSDQASVCQYRHDGTQMRLWSSRLVTGSQATDVTTALRTLPAGNTPATLSCQDSDSSPVVALHPGAVTAGASRPMVRVEYQGCARNGVVTRAGVATVGPVCSAVFSEPISRVNMVEPLLKQCGFPIPSAPPT